MAAEGLPVQLACRVLAVSESGFYAAHDRPPSARAIRHAFFTELIRRVHLDGRGTYGARRIHAELTLGHGLVVGHCAVEMLMRRAGIAGVSGSRSSRRIPHVATASDLVERRFRSDDSESTLGHRHHRAPRHARARSIARSSSTCSAAESSAGRSTARRRLLWSPTLWAWPFRTEIPTGRSSTPTRARSSRLGRSPGGRSTRDFCPRWARSGPATTVRLPLPGPSGLTLVTTDRTCPGC